MGCSGGLMSRGFKFSRDHGMLLESEYPYTAKNGSCSKKDGKFKNKSYKVVGATDD